MKALFTVIVSALLAALSAPAQNPKYHLVQQEEQENVSPNGGSVTTSIIKYTYDGERLVRTISELDLNRDGVMDVRTTIVWTWNTAAQRVAATRQSETISDGRITGRSTSVYDYDEQGRLISALTQADGDADGRVD